MKEKGERFRLVAGVDEAGRGPLAGPVVAAACTFSQEVLIEGIDDSKKLSAKKRFELYEKLIHHPGVDYGVGIIDAIIIDEINILQATFRAMIMAVAQLKNKPDYLLVDGPHLPKIDILGEGVIGGDGLSILIAAASIIAKETRDRIMRDYHLKWPQYGFDQHKGYGTKKHLDALELYGPCPIHRNSFRPVYSSQIQ
ncbi:MAG: ribonuclease HII [Chlamydiota bacterium]